MYLDFTLKKSLSIIIIAVIVLGAIYYTFSYKNDNYGNVRLPVAVSRWWQKESLFVKYSLRGMGPQGLMAALGRLSFRQDDTSGLGTPAVPVLLYHSIVKEAGSHNITEDNFADQMFALKAAGWQTITTKQLKEFLNTGKTVPARSFLVTFDDGARDSFYPSDPIFKSLGFNGVSFILPKYSQGGGSHYYLSEGEIKDMLASGRWEIGSHGQNAHDETYEVHPSGDTGAYLAHRLWLSDLNRMETIDEFLSRVSADLAESRANLEKMFNIPITIFAFPFGEFGQLSDDSDPVAYLREATEQIYDLSFYQTYRGEGFSYNYYNQDKPTFMVKRIGVLPEWSGEDLLSILERGEPKNLPYTDTFNTDQGWFSIWGDYKIEENQLHLDSDATETGSGVVLDGTAHWDNYRLTATVESPSQTGVLLWVRMEDNKNHAACNFGNGFVHVEETLNNVRSVIKGERRANLTIPAGQFTVSAEVEGRRVSCYLNDKKLVETTFLDPSLERGGIGIKIWDAVAGRSEVWVKQVEVLGLETL